jgi:16S rRNA (cytidine1402-2'-O)-methyltransferase
MGSLSIVATPLGNLEDITFRAIRTLREADLVLCEDTRVTKKLLSHFDIHTPTMAYHAHSKAGSVQKVIALLEEGKHIALVSDAGTPAISDPGAYLVSQVRDALPDIQIVPVPGPSAVVAALSVSGAPSDSYDFIGFLPHKKGRMTLLDAISKNNETMVLYESPHRIRKLMSELGARMPERTATICRELTKKFEQVVVGTVESLALRVEKDIPARGEFVVVIHPC